MIKKYGSFKNSDSKEEKKEEKKEKQESKESDWIDDEEEDTATGVLNKD